VTGGTFFRSYDGVSTGYQSKAYPATLSSFRLDRFEATVGRFRRFVAAWNGGWRPVAGAGKHAHLDGGSGLINAGAAGNEPGWDSTWDSNVAPTDQHLTGCDTALVSWTPTPVANEALPIDCTNWFEAYAFCIWDGGFLPSEAEWNYAAAGGTEQRVYPWSSPADSPTITCSNAVYAPTPPCVIPVSLKRVGSKSPAGDGLYRQADLAGNVWEWTFDQFTNPYVAACTDCTYLSVSATDRCVRGGAFDSNYAGSLFASTRSANNPSTRSESTGFRCARAP
jgi:formylglycine-generating enzyme required for sulfatase activity